MPDILPAPDQQPAPAAPFVWGSGGVQMTPERIAAARKVAQAMQATGMDFSPIRSPFQGVSRVAQALMGAYDEKRANEAENANAAADKALVSSWFGGGAPAAPAAVTPAPAGAAPVPSMPTPAPTVLGAGGQPAVADAQGVYGSDAVMMPQSAPAPDYSKAIASIESAGQPNPYAAVGPVTRTGDRAYGKYQVMGANIPAWTKEHLGQEMTPQQFAASPQAQDAVFNGQFGKYVQQTGNPQDAASMWFTGKPQAQGASLSDVNGTTGQSYVQRFTKALGPTAPPAVAAAEDPAALPPNATPTQGTIPPGVTAPSGPATPTVAPGVQGVAGAMQGVNPGVVAAMQSPYTSDATKKIAALILQHQMGDKVSYQTQPDGTILQMDPMGKAPPKIVYQGVTKPKFTQISEGFGGDKKFGFVDEATRKTYDASGKLIDGGPNSPQVGSIPAGADGQPMQGPELLSHLEKTDPIAAAGVKGIIAGDINAGGRNLQKLLPLAELVDPTMKQFDYASRSKTQLNYRSGAASNEIKAYNTAINHADKLAGISEKLGGSDIMPGVLNPLAQSFKRNTGDKVYQDAQKEWDATSETLSTEVSKAMNGGVPHVADKEHWRKVFESAGSPTERKAAIRSVMSLLEGRLGAAAQNYNQGMGTNREPLSFLDPSNVGKFQKLLGTGIAADASAPPAAAAPAAGANTTKSGVTWSVE